MKLLWTQDAWADYMHWQAVDAKLARRLNELIRDTLRHPFTGLGKPEPLRSELSGWWSRRITQEHRFVYRVVGAADTQALEVIQCRFHYR